MATLPCPRCGQPRSAHASCPQCGAPGLSTDVPPLPDLDLADEASTPPSVVRSAGALTPPMGTVQRSDTLSRAGYLVAAVLAAGVLMLVHGAVWGDHDAQPETPAEEVFDSSSLPDIPLPPTPPEPPAVPDVPRPPGMSDDEWNDMQRDLREARREAEQAVEEAQREIEQAAREAEREARRR